MLCLVLLLHGWAAFLCLVLSFRACLYDTAQSKTEKLPMFSFSSQQLLSQKASLWDGAIWVCKWRATVQQPKEKIQIHFGLSAEAPKLKHPIEAPAFSDWIQLQLWTNRACTSHSWRFAVKEWGTCNQWQDLWDSWFGHVIGITQNFCGNCSQITRLFFFFMQFSPLSVPTSCFLQEVRKKNHRHLLIFKTCSSQNPHFSSTMNETWILWKK